MVWGLDPKEQVRREFSRGKWRNYCALPGQAELLPGRAGQSYCRAGPSRAIAGQTIAGPGKKARANGYDLDAVWRCVAEGK